MATEGDITALLEEGFVSTYTAEAEALRFEVLRLAGEGSPHFPQFEHAFGKPMRDISSFRIRPLKEGAFCFDPASGLFVLNLQPLLVLMGQVLDDIRRADHGRHFLDRDEIHPLMRRVFRLYVLHEVRHLAQGIGDYASVGAVKKIAGHEFLADLDLFADRDAAAAYAALQTYGRGADRSAYLQHFGEALFFSGQYSFPVFRFTLDRAPKMSRAIALTLMAARLARLDLEHSDISELERFSPLDGCVTVKVSPDYCSIIVVLSDPDTHVINITCEVPDGKLRALASAIEDGDFLSAVDIASVLLSRMSLIP